METVINMEPINRIAGMVTSQAGCSDDFYLNPKDIFKLIEKISLRREELKKELGITTKRQLKNLMYFRNNPVKKNKDGSVTVQRYGRYRNKLFAELIETGIKIQELNREARKLKKASK